MRWLMSRFYIKEVLVITKEPLGRFCKCLKESSSILSVMLSRENKWWPLIKGSKQKQVTCEAMDHSPCASHPHMACRTALILAKRRLTNPWQRSNLPENTESYHFNMLPPNSERCLSDMLNCSVWSHIHTRCSRGILNGRPWLLKAFQHCKCATMDLYSLTLGTEFRNSNKLHYDIFKERSFTVCVFLTTAFRGLVVSDNRT